MPRIAALSFAICVAVAAIAPNPAQAADTTTAAKGDKVSIMGKVSVTRGSDVDDYKTIKLTTPDGKIHNITIDAKGKDLAKMYEGISIQVNGTEVTKDKELWLTVLSTGEKKRKGK